MNNKNYVLFFFIMVFIFACREDYNPATENENKLITIAGKTMGTTYHIKYIDPDKRKFQTSIDSILVEINSEVSTYITTSAISIFNSKDTVLDLTMYKHFMANFIRSRELNTFTEGYFDPTVMPLVNYWGFGYKGKKAVERIDSLKIKEIMVMIGMNWINVEETDSSYQISKLNAHTELDFSAIAKGYGRSSNVS